MSNELDGLKQLAYELYNEGAHSGLLSDEWFEAYARAMKAVADGEPYTERLVDKKFDELKGEQQ